jgi:sodium-dependent dicarboxylate transporter 2/3/5
VQDVRRLSWEVLWLVSGGIALGLALDETGLAKHIIDSIPFASFPAITIVWLTTVIAILMSTFMSHTATANLMMPIMAALGAALPALESIGGSKALILGVAISCSLAMALPISTPPNAMAHATGEVETRHMLRTGLIIGLVGLLAVHGLLILLNNIGVL